MAAEMLKKGAFSYQNDDINYLRITGTNLTIRVERINNDVARVYIVNQHHVQQQIPANITMRDATNNVIHPFGDNFLISWSNSYILEVDGVVFMTLNQQKQQSIMGPAGADSGIVGDDN